MSFGQVIAEARKKRGLSLKELASRLCKEDGTPISPQYLNDIEHERRNPPSGHLLQQLSHELGLEQEVLYYLAGQYPEDIRHATASPERVREAFQAFRRALKEPPKP